jgi:peptidoglycan/LPS O-acetylase OafA/YrhL
MFGVLLSWLVHFKNLENIIARIPSVLLFIAGIVLFSPAFIFQLENTKFIYVYGFILFYIASGFFIFAALRYKKANHPTFKILATLGAASYSIYLWHMPIATWGSRLISELLGVEYYFLYLLNAVIGACICGWFLNRLIENQVLQVRDHFFPPLLKKGGLLQK